MIPRSCFNKKKYYLNPNGLPYTTLFLKDVRPIHYSNLLQGQGQDQFKSSKRRRAQQRRRPTHKLCYTCTINRPKKVCIEKLFVLPSQNESWVDYFQSRWWYEVLNVRGVTYSTRLSVNICVRISDIIKHSRHFHSVANLTHQRSLIFSGFISWD